MLSITSSPLETLTPQQAFNNCRNAIGPLRTEPVSERKKRLLSLRRWIHDNRREIQDAVWSDFRKPAMETDATEIFHVLNEIKVALANLDRWTSPRKIDAPIYLTGTRAWIHYEPRGVCLIISPWNYPFSLATGPLVSALAAGNSVIIKPSELTPAVSSVIRKMCSDIFPPSLVTVCEGGVEVSQVLLSLPFDHIFFTGSPTVGKIVMKAAAEYLASVTLELGGKSPAIVTASARLADSAERIAVGKFLNNGQTCIAPDYLLVEEKVSEEFVLKLKEKATKLYGSQDKLEQSPDYGRIVNEAHFTRIDNLIQDGIDRGAKIEWEGKRDKANRFIHPVILSEVPMQSRLMNEEIFGPVLPVVTYSRIDEAVAIINSKPKPLALYIFSSRKSEREKILKETSAGTVCINDCGIQFLHHELPFGGINNSGIGKSHGYHGFLAFSNEKPILKQRDGMTAIQAFYPPFTNRKKRIMDWFLKLF